MLHVLCYMLLEVILAEIGRNKNRSYCNIDVDSLLSRWGNLFKDRPCELSLWTL